MQVARKKKRQIAMVLVNPLTEWLKRREAKIAKDMEDGNPQQRARLHRLMQRLDSNEPLMSIANVVVVANAGDKLPRHCTSVAHKTVHVFGNSADSRACV